MNAQRIVKDVFNVYCNIFLGFCSFFFERKSYKDLFISERLQFLKTNFVFFIYLFIKG